MGRKQSERERLLAYAMSAETPQLEEALEIFRVALRQRTGGTRKTTKASSKRSTKTPAADRQITGGNDDQDQS